MPRLDMPTLYAAVAACCLVMSLVWMMAARSFPTLTAARYWAAAMLAVATGAATSIFRGHLEPLVPILVANALFLLGGGMVWAGARRFRGRPVPWLAITAVVCGALAGLAAYSIWHDDIAVRMVIYSLAQSTFAVGTLSELLGDANDCRTPGVRMAAAACIAMVMLYIARSIFALSAIGGDVAFVALNPLQGVLLFLLASSGALVCQFGCLLMAMHRLRTEMAHLAAIDDLTGIANRRRFLDWVDQECARSARTGQPFTLMIIDIDRFKWINDTYGHAVGDEFLRLFTQTTLSHLRSQDMFARLGGDEFCILLPETGAGDANVFASRLVAKFRAQALFYKGAKISSTLSVGLAEWTAATGRDFIGLLALADRALYSAKEHGRDGVAVGGVARATPPPLPDHDIAA